MTDDELRRIADSRRGYATYPGITPAGDPTWKPLRRIRTQDEIQADPGRYWLDGGPDVAEAAPAEWPDDAELTALVVDRINRRWWDPRGWWGR